jgi:DNA-binding phage protein
LERSQTGVRNSPLFKPIGTYSPSTHWKKDKETKINIMSITRDFKETVCARVQREPEFAKGLLDEAVSLFLNGEPEIARLILRDLVNATTGFEALAHETSLPSKSLHRMLSAKGNPTMNNLNAIFIDCSSSICIKKWMLPVKEVWFWISNKLEIYVLIDDSYQQQNRS